MENLHTQSDGLCSPMQIIENFKSTFTRIQDVKDTLIRVFIGFYASDHSNYLEQPDREDISFHINQVLDLITRIEKFNN
jgi:hypothetical protein